MTETKDEERKRLRRERRKERRQQRRRERQLSGAKKVRSKRICGYCRKKKGIRYLYPFLDPKTGEVKDVWEGAMACDNCYPEQLEKLKKAGLLEKDEGRVTKVNWDAIEKAAEKDEVEKKAEKRKARRDGKPRKPAGPNLTGTVRTIIQKDGPMEFGSILAKLHKKAVFSDVPRKKLRRVLYRLHKKQKGIAQNPNGMWRYVK